MGVGLSLQHRGPSSPPRAEQQGPSQALTALGRAVCHRGSTSARCLQVENHQWRGLHQRLEHRTATSLLPLNKRILGPYQFFVFTNPRSIATSNPSKMQGVIPRSGAGTNDISMFTLQTPHVSKLSLSSPFFLINVSQKLGLREPILSITGRTTGNPRPSGYGLLAHQRDQNRFARTPSFCELDHEKNRKAPKNLFQKRGN